MFRSGGLISLLESSLQRLFSVFRKIIHIMDLSVNCLKAVMTKSVGNGKIGGLQRKVVPAYLCKGCLANGYKWRFAFDKQEWVARIRQYHDVRPFGECIVFHAGFDGEKRLGVTVMAYQ